MAYKVFTNGSPLPASDLNTYLMNQSVMVFANSTARSAALTSPTEGMTTYLEDTNKVEVWTGAAWTDINDNSAAIPKSTVTTAGDLIVADGNASVTRLGIGANGSIPRVAAGALGYLSVGTDGQVLTVSSGAPTWVTPSGGGLVSLATGNLSSTTTINSISQSYKSLLLTINNAKTSTGTAIRMRLNGDTTSKYAQILSYVQASSANGTTGSSSSTSIDIGNLQNSSDACSSVVNIYNYTNSTTMIPINGSFFDDDTANSSYRVRHFGAGYKSSAAITSLTIFIPSGTMSSGTYTLYGVQ